MQGRNRDADIQNKHTDMEREGEGARNWKIRTDIYTLPNA